MSGPSIASTAPSNAFLERFRQAARANGGSLRFDAFVGLALYDPEVGYYVRDRARVGRRAGTDFYTASSSGTLFGELVCAACVKLLGRDGAADATFVEIGAETSAGILAGVEHPFAAVRTVRIGEPLTVNGHAVVFSNELFDAQPFRRIVREAQGWQETWVRLEENALREELRPLQAETLGSLASELPTDVPTGYRIDLPLAAMELARQIVTQPWTGMFLAFDYGKTWPQLATECPHGTARAYFQHQQERDLLARPGEQDLTCHICWDWLTDVVSAAGFSNAAVASQESFFMHHASEFIARTIEAEAAKFSPRKMGLLQLLHPGNMGQKFQALSAIRPANDQCPMTNVQ